jgi:hypothetical protein
VSGGGRVESGLGRGTTTRGGAAGVGVVTALVVSGVARRGAACTAAGGESVVLVAFVPGWWNSTGCKNDVAIGTPRRLAGANRNRVEPASAAESSAG